MSVVLLNSERHWVCPNCSQTAVTTKGETNRFHQCAGLRGITAPLVLEGTDCRVVAIEREDYVGREAVQRDQDGRPISFVETLRADGSTDLAVLAPTARVSAAALI